MAHEDIVARVARYYTGKLREHGPVARGVDWNSHESQALRFEQLRRVVDDPGRRFSLNDYGCGYGALVEHLRGAGLDFAYRGYDVSQEMVRRASELHAGQPDVEWTADTAELRPADYTVASGVFNVRLDVPEAQWSAYVLEGIATLARLSRRGFAFNLLTKYSDPERKRPDLHYADPCALFDHCQRTYSRQVALLHDYGLYEFTLLVRLEGGTPWPGS